MSAEDFFSRWARKNQEAQEAKAAKPPPDPSPPPPDPYEGRPPTLEDLEQLSPQADFSPFMKEGVDETVKRSALKKLFSDPHFNIMDGLDVYIDDYTKPDPIPPEMMAMLQHAKTLFEPEGLKDKAVMAMQSQAELPPPANDELAAAANDAQAQPQPADDAAQEPPPQLEGDPDPAQAAPASPEADAPGTSSPSSDTSTTTNQTSGNDPETETPRA